ncbi:hypothetical protein ANTQUA_LOCUS7360 [Anthophora quadrimaculata]
MKKNIEKKNTRFFTCEDNLSATGECLSILLRQHQDRIYSFELIFWAWNHLLDCPVMLRGKLTPWLGKREPICTNFYQF